MWVKAERSSFFSVGVLDVLKLLKMLCHVSSSPCLMPMLHTSDLRLLGKLQKMAVNQNASLI